MHDVVFSCDFCESDLGSMVVGLEGDVVRVYEIFVFAKSVACGTLQSKNFSTESRLKFPKWIVKMR